MRVPYRGCIRVPICHPTIRPIGPVQRGTRIPIGTPSRANVSPYAPRPSAMANLSAIGVNTSFPLRHPSKIRCRCRGNHRKAQGCACQETGNKLLHCNPRYREARSALYMLARRLQCRPNLEDTKGSIEAACHRRRRTADGTLPIKLNHWSLREPAGPWEARASETA